MRVSENAFAKIPAELRRLRSRVDTLDEQILSLLVQRLETAGEIARVKRRSCMALHDPDREQEVLERARNFTTNTAVMSACGECAREGFARIFAEIIACSRAYQLAVGDSHAG